MKQNRSGLNALRITLLVLTALTAVMAFLPLLEVEKGVSLAFDSTESAAAPEVSFRTIDGMWLLAVCSAMRCLLVTLRKPAADAISVLLAVGNSAWVWFVPRLRTLIRELLSDMNNIQYDPVTGSVYYHSYGMAPLAWVLIGLNVVCAVLTVAAMVRDKNAEYAGGDLRG